jgi:hypothetical protein
MKKSELATVIREEFLALLKEDRKSKEYIMSIEDEEEREEERKRMFGSDEGGIKEETAEDIKAKTAAQAELNKELEKTKELVGEEMDDDEMDKAAAKGAKGKDAKGVAAQATAALKAQTKKKALKAFMDKMKAAGVVSDSNKVLDAGKYKEEFAKFKASL